jgi:hypothetical protein
MMDDRFVLNQASGDSPKDAGVGAAGEPRGRSKRGRASRGQVRAWAWTLGALSFLSPWALLGLSPRPAQTATAAWTQATTPQHRPVVVIVTKKIVLTQQQAAPTVVSGGGSAPSYVYSAPAPVAVSCGSHPC